MGERKQIPDVSPDISFAGPNGSDPFDRAGFFLLVGIGTGDRENRLAARKLRVATRLVAVVDLDAECFGKAVANLGGGARHAWFVVAGLGDASADGLSWSASLLKHAEENDQWSRLMVAMRQVQLRLLWNCHRLCFSVRSCSKASPGSSDGQ